MSQNNSIYVYLDIDNSPQLLGVLHAQITRGKELFSFEFDKSYLQSNQAQFFDPDLQFYAGPQFINKPNFGVFMDSAPDRWGRKLMLRREAILAKKSNKEPRKLMESDFLLGVFDECRMGALRFKNSVEGNFLNDDITMSAPPWTKLRDLEEASRHFEDDSTTNEQEKWLAMLLAPGSSLGGARPKASVIDPQGDLWIAKFPSKNDETNSAAWEYATMLMANDVGIKIPKIKLENFSKFGSTFLSKRFDRDGKKRIHFASAMTLLGKSDGDNSNSGSSYLDIAKFITQYGCNVEFNLLELWRRIVFSIAVSNTDDHLRNHGFLLEKSGWQLSPAYDINPNPYGMGLSLNISESDNQLKFDIAQEVAPYFRVEKKEATAIINQTKAVVSKWREYAKRAGINQASQEQMQTAFKVVKA